MTINMLACRQPRYAVVDYYMSMRCATFSDILVMSKPQRRGIQ